MKPIFQFALAGGLAVLSTASSGFAHGTLTDSRILQVRLAGPHGHTPVTWNESYYTWNQNSNNFPDYNAPEFTYASYVPDGKISNAGVNDGIHGGLNFSGLNTPSDGWAMVDATAGFAFPMTWLATAAHEPSHFNVYLTDADFDVGTQQMGWSDLDFLGIWSLTDADHLVTLGTGINPVDGSPLITYNWSIPIPTDRLGHVAAVVIWQREDPAGEAFFATLDLNVQPVPEPSAFLLIGMGLAAAHLAAVWIRQRAPSPALVRSRPRPAAPAPARRFRRGIPP